MSDFKCAGCGQYIWGTDLTEHPGWHSGCFLRYSEKLPFTGESLQSLRAEVQHLRSQLDAAFSALAGRMTQEARSTDAEELAKGVERLVEETLRNKKRLCWVLDQLSPSMFPDHGIAALKKIADAMRNGRSGGQSQRGLAAIDAAAQALLAPAVQEAPPEPGKPIEDDPDSLTGTADDAIPRGAVEAAKKWLERVDKGGV